MAQNSKTRELQTLLDTYMYSTSDSVSAKTLKVRKIHSYNDILNLTHTLFGFFCSSSSSVELTYRKNGTSTFLDFCMKRLLSLSCVILDQENLRNLYNPELPYLSIVVGSHFLIVRAHAGSSACMSRRRWGSYYSTTVKQVSK